MGSFSTKDGVTIPNICLKLPKKLVEVVAKGTVTYALFPDSSEMESPADQ